MYYKHAVGEDIQDEEADEMIKLFTNETNGLMKFEDFLKISKMEVDV